MDESAVQRELGGISVHLANIDSKLGDVLEQAKITNGRVDGHDVDIAVIKANLESQAQLHQRVTSLESRPRAFAVGVIVPIFVAFLVVFLPHVL